MDVAVLGGSTHVLFPAAKCAGAFVALPSDLMFPAGIEFVPLAGGAGFAALLWNGFQECPPLLLPPLAVPFPLWVPLELPPELPPVA